MVNKIRRLHEVRQVQIGITTRCNSHCRFCFREELLAKRGDKMHFYHQPADLPFDVFKKIFVGTQLKDVQFCGNKGDAIFHPEFEKILDYTIDQGVFISLATNGSNFSNDWWYNLGKRMKGEVTFGIDGFKDTHSLYRSTSFIKVYNNMVSYIKGGGSARWQFIVFKHNEHQLEKAKKLSKEIGCTKFITVISRYYDDVMQRPEMATAKNTKREMFEKVKERKKLKTLFFGEPECQWIRMKRIYVSSRGYVYPCCYACCNLTDWFTQRELVEFKDATKGPDCNLKHNTIDNIINSKWFTYIYDNMDNLSMCNLHCTNLDTYKTKIRREEKL